MMPFAPSTIPSPFGESGWLLTRNLPVGVNRFDVLRDQPADDALLLRDAADCVYDGKSVFVHDAIVFFEHFALKQPEALHWIRTPAEIHARFVELQFHAAGQQPIDGHVNRHSEV